MNDLDTKCRLSVHLILGAGEYAKLKTESAPKMTANMRRLLKIRGKQALSKEQRSRAQVYIQKFNIAHKPVVQGTAELTKLPVVYDTSARAFDGAPSLNGCLNAVPRSLAVHQGDILHIELHSFVDACANGAACVYGVICQTSGTYQGLIAARSRLAKQGLTIPQMELVAGHMAVNLVANVQKCTGWASHKQDTLLAGQFSSLVQDQGTRRVQAVCCKSCQED